MKVTKALSQFWGELHMQWYQLSSNSEGEKLVIRLDFLQRDFLLDTDLTETFPTFKLGNFREKKALFYPDKMKERNCFIGVMLFFTFLEHVMSHYRA